MGMPETVEYMSPIRFWHEMMAFVESSTSYAVVFRSLQEGVEKDMLFSYIDYASESVPEAITLAYLAGYSAKAINPVYPCYSWGREPSLSEALPETERRAWSEWLDVIRLLEHENKLTQIRDFAKVASHEEILQKVSVIADYKDEAIVLAFYGGMAHALRFRELLREHAEELRR